MTDTLLSGFTVGRYRVLPRQNRLEGPDGSHHVEPRAMAVLLVLAARPGQLVTREELLSEVWSDVVVLDENLTKAIQILRGHFGDKPANPEFIRTVPRKGYELIAPVGALGDGEPDPAAAEHASLERQGLDARPAREPSKRLGWALTGLTLLALVAVTIFLVNGRSTKGPVTVAVIPPVTSGDPADLGFVGEGLADYLIDQLSRAPHLQVVARRSSFGMRDTASNVRAIGEQLGAQYLVEGSLRGDAGGLLLTLFLVNTESGTNLWTTRLRGTVDEVIRLEERAAEVVRAALGKHLGISLGPPAARRQAIPEQAYRKYLEARYQWTLRGERRIDRSLELLESALALEPGYAAAHLALAQSVAVRPFYTDEPVAIQFERARASAARALSLDATLAADVAALEGFMLFKERRWSEANSSLRQALELAPENVNALYWYSWFLSQLGRYDEALAHMQIAQKLDPVSAVLNDRLAIAYVWANDLERAAERYRIAMELGYLENTQPLSMMMFLYRSGRFDDLGNLLLRLGADATWVEPTVDALEHPGQRETVSMLIDSLEDPDPVLDMARFGIWLLFGQTDRAFRDFDAGPKSPYVEALWSPEASHLRADPRFEGLLEGLGFSGADRALLPDY